MEKSAKKFGTNMVLLSKSGHSFPFTLGKDEELERVKDSKVEASLHYDGLHYVAEDKSLLALADGEVTALGTSQRLGSYIVVKYYNGYFVAYALCSKINKKVGDKVKAGEPIAFSLSSVYIFVHQGRKFIDCEEFLKILAANIALDKQKAFSFSLPTGRTKMEEKALLILINIYYRDYLTEVIDGTWQPISELFARVKDLFINAALNVVSDDEAAAAFQTTFLNDFLHYLKSKKNIYLSIVDDVETVDPLRHNFGIFC